MIVVLVGEEYKRKERWGVELREIREIIMEREEKRIMLVSVEDGDVDGVFRKEG